MFYDLASCVVGRGCWPEDGDDDDLHQLMYSEACAATWFSLFIQSPLFIPSKPG